MELSVVNDPGSAETAVIHVSGDLDLASGSQVYRTLAQLRDEGRTTLRVDVSRCDFVDSAGLSVLLRWQDEARQLGHGFAVTGARGLVRRVLRVSGVEGILGARA